MRAFKSNRWFFFITKYISLFDENNFNIGTTSFLFHAIKTAYIRPIRIPVKRLPYGEIQAAVKSNIK